MVLSFRLILIIYRISLLQNCLKVIIHNYYFLLCACRITNAHSTISSVKIGISLSWPFSISFLLPSWRAVQSYRPHLEERDPIWGNDWLHSPFIRWSPSWGFLGFYSVWRFSRFPAFPPILYLLHTKCELLASCQMWELQWSGSLDWAPQNRQAVAVSSRSWTVVVVPSPLVWSWKPQSRTSPESVGTLESLHSPHGLPWSPLRCTPPFHTVTAAVKQS